MPKVVDHDARRQELAEATWRLIRREGLEAVSVRKVAREAGVSPGSLRHYFTSQSELLAYALRMVGERIEQRIRSLEPGQTLEDHVQALIEQVLPLDEERATEAVIWLAFVGKALVDPELAKLATETHNALYHLFHQLIKAMVRHGALPRETDVELEARRLHALVDGLALHGVASEEPLSPQMIRQIVAHHLEQLAAKAGAVPGRGEA
ncbi:MAG: TetR family transcriptional regulator [Firmicutes bacterium]|nr:TetR family transcriptional regulator [Bacillota bacterium]MBO2521416.1 TetR family transcriptional regulator [Bacillota bacterium]